MKHRKYQLELCALDESIYSPWEYQEPDEEENQFLPPSSGNLASAHEQTEESCFPQHHSCQLEAPSQKRHITTRSTIHSPRPHHRRETGSQNPEKRERPQTFSSPNKAKKVSIRQSKSLDNRQDSVFFTNNVICLKFKQQTEKSGHNPPKDIKGGRKSHLSRFYCDNLANSGEKGVSFGWCNSEKFNVQDPLKELKLKEYSQLFKKQRLSDSQNFAIKRNMLRVGRSRKLAQML